MTLRARIAGAAGLAAAVAVLVAAVSLYVAVRSDLRSEVDSSLTQRAQGFVPGAAANSGRFTRGGGSAPPGASPNAGSLPVGQGPPPDRDGDGFPNNVQPLPLGGPSGYIQFVAPSGAVQVPGGQGSSTAIPLSASDKAIAASGTGRALSDRTVKGTRLRVLTLGTGSRGAVMVARPLTEVDKELSRLLLVLAIVAIAGIALAAALGALVGRAALAPIARFTRRTETLAPHSGAQAGSLDLSERLPSGGRDELGRLAASFNATLDALERSVEAQRNLVADAGHELRTPIASLRANIQTLADADRLPPEDQAGLRADIISELDELTRLVGDVIELARGSERRGAVGDVALDEIVRAAVQRSQRRSDLAFRVNLQPTLVSGVADRIDRAVSNLLENASKWSPPDEPVEVDLRDGLLTIRDHGPGFAEADLPHVFERFYRADAARGQPGSGLGLAIVRQAAEAHGGSVAAENAPGGGALVRISFSASPRRQRSVTN